MTSIGLLLRVAITCGYLGLLLRGVGRRGWQAIRPLDLMLAFVLGNVGREIIIGRISVLPGLTALGTLLMLQLSVTTLLRYAAPLRRLIWGAPATLVNRGIMQRQALAQCGVTEEDVFAVMREAGISRLAHIHELRQESDGEFVLIPTDGQRPLSPDEAHALPGAVAAKEESIWRRAA